MSRSALEGRRCTIRLRCARAVAFALACSALFSCSSGDDDSGKSSGVSGKSKTADQCKSGGTFGNVCTDTGTGGAGKSGSHGTGTGGSATSSGSSGQSGSDRRRERRHVFRSVNVSATRVVPTVDLVIDGSCSMELDLTSQEPYGSCAIEMPVPTSRWGALRRR